MNPVLSTTRSDLEMVEALRRGDEGAFAELVRDLQPGLRRVVAHYVSNSAVAEDVLQETWLGVVRGIFAFECRSSLRTWVYRIMINRAKSRAALEHRAVPFAELGTPTNDESDELLEPGPSPEDVLLGHEARRRLAGAIAELSATQRLIVTLRELEGWSAQEVCNAFGIQETNQRVILHRARGALRVKLGESR